MKKSMMGGIIVCACVYGAGVYAADGVDKNMPTGPVVQASSLTPQNPVIQQPPAPVVEAPEDDKAAQISQLKEEGKQIRGSLHKILDGKKASPSAASYSGQSGAQDQVISNGESDDMDAQGSLASEAF